MQKKAATSSTKFVNNVYTTADKSESEEKLQKEMELYKNYFKIDQVNKDHLMEYHMKIIQIMKLVVMKK